MATKDISDLQVCEAVQHFCEQLRQRAVDIEWPYERMAVETGECEKVCYRAMERAENRGLVEYGTSLRSGWLTEKGKALLEFSK